MALTESQKVALRRIMTNAPGNPDRSLVRMALDAGMSERAIMSNLRMASPSSASSAKPFSGGAKVAAVTEAANEKLREKARKLKAANTKSTTATAKMPSTKDAPFSGGAKVADYTKKQNEALLAKARAKRDAEKATAKKRSADPLGLASPKTKAKAAPTSAAAKKKTKAPAKKAETKAKNYNVGVSKGGVSFNEAFAHFRKKGAKTFTWNGKKYHTKTKSEMKKG